jgi:hypothetical protein
MVLGKRLLISSGVLDIKPQRLLTRQVLRSICIDGSVPALFARLLAVIVSLVVKICSETCSLLLYSISKFLYISRLRRD